MKPVFITLHYTIFLVIFEMEIHTKTRQTCVHLILPISYLWQAAIQYESQGQNDV